MTPPPRHFAVSGRMVRELRALLQHSDRDQGSVDSLPLFREATSYLRFLGIVPPDGEGWRFSLIVVDGSYKPENGSCLPPVGSLRCAALMNLSEHETIRVLVGDRPVVMKPLSGLIEEPVRSSEIQWRLEDPPARHSVALLVASAEQTT